MKKFIIAIFYAASGLTVSAAETDQEVYDHLMRRSTAVFESLVKEYGCSDGGDWKPVIETTFAKLIAASGRYDDLTVCVVSRPGFNAAAMLSGHFIIHKDALQVLGVVAKQIAGTDLAAEQFMREVLLVGIVGHELAHFYNQHTFKTYQKLYALGKGKSDKEVLLTQRQNSREHEFDADRTGFLLVKKAGYDASRAMTLTFEVMKAIDDQGKESGAAGTHYFLQTHPLNRERLAQFESEKQDWYRETAQLEKAFDDVNAAFNLKNAAEVLNQAAQKYPDNAFMKQALAVARHKRWLETVSLREQKLRAILDLPSFVDQMLETTRGSKGAKTIPGDKALFFAARKEYENFFTMTTSAIMKSNYAVLLAYSNEPADTEKAKKIAVEAGKERKSVQTLNNMAVTFFLTGDEKTAVGLFAQLSGQIEKVYGSAKREAMVPMFQMMSQNQVIDAAFVVPDFTIMLNYALVLQQTQQANEAKSIALQYLEQYDASSTWARHLAKLTGQTNKLAKKVEPKYIEVRGVKIGSTVADVVKAWKAQKQVGVSQEKEEIWYYPDFGAKLKVDGFVQVIVLAEPKSPKFSGGVGVGSARVQLEKVLGQASSLRNGYHCYNGGQPACVLYQNGKAAEIVFLPGLN